MTELEDKVIECQKTGRYNEQTDRISYCTLLGAVCSYLEGAYVLIHNRAHRLCNKNFYFAKNSKEEQK